LDEGDGGALGPHVAVGNLDAVRRADSPIGNHLGITCDDGPPAQQPRSAAAKAHAQAGPRTPVSMPNLPRVWLPVPEAALASLGFKPGPCGWSGEMVPEGVLGRA
jgi:hypothetical protein